MFKSILDYGRKSVQLTFDAINYNLKEKSNQSSIKVELTKIIEWLRGNSSMEKLSAIWRNKEELKKSNLDKVSFEILLIKLEEIVERLKKKKKAKIFEIEELKDFHSSISQKFIFIDENTLNSDVIENILEDYRFKGDKIFKEKKEFLMNILSQFDFVIPTKRLKYKMDDLNVLKNVRKFVVPLLFPPYKPSNFSSSVNKTTLRNLKNKNGLNNSNNNLLIEEWINTDFRNEWTIDYFLPFKPSAVWKLLFMRLRKTCVGSNESQRLMVDEVYWMNGFSFYLTENDKTKVFSI